MLERLRQNWELYIYENVLSDSVQPVVAKSWEKCKRYGVDPQKGLGKMADEAVFSSILEENRQLLETARPIMQSVYEIVNRSHFLFVLTDSAGYVMETIGDQTIAFMAEDLRFVPGTLWSDLQVGSNAIGVALDYDVAIQMVGPEHYCVQHHSWTCSAAPIHGLNGEIVGCLNMSGACADAHAHTLGIVVAAAFGIETQLLSVHSARLMQSALDANSDSMLLLSEEFRPIWANRSALHLLKMSPEDMNDGDFRPIMPEVDWNQVQQWDKGGQYYTNDTPLKLKDKTVYCSASISPTLTGTAGKAFSVTLKRQEQVIRSVNLMSGNRATYTFDDIYAQNPIMKKTVTMAQRFARYDGSVLIEGESGTGKELFAQAIHNASERAKGPFVAINCASLPRDLIESELFGYEKGAFTGALREGNPGKFELANHGTIFLDEIGEMPLEFQTKLLRVVETKMVRRLGGSQEKKLDVRIVAATNRNLKLEVDTGRFRGDLYFRLNVLKLDIPPLRDRLEDILYCTDRFLDHFNKRYPELEKSMSREFMQALEAYEWPGNVRELQNSIERAFYACAGSELSAEDIQAAIGSSAPSLPAASPPATVPQPSAEEHQRVVQALLDAGCNVEAAAKALDLSRASLYRRLKQWEINPKALRKGQSV